MLGRLILILCGSMAALTLITPTAQAAETITVGFGADPTEEVPLPVTATWVSALPSPEVFVTVKPAGGLGCAGSYAADEPRKARAVLEVRRGGRRRVKDARPVKQRQAKLHWRYPRGVRSVTVRVRLTRRTGKRRTLAVGSWTTLKVAKVKPGAPLAPVAARNGDALAGGGAREPRVDGGERFVEALCEHEMERVVEQRRRRVRGDGERTPRVEAALGVVGGELPREHVPWQAAAQLATGALRCRQRPAHGDPARRARRSAATRR